MGSKKLFLISSSCLYSYLLERILASFLALAMLPELEHTWGHVETLKRNNVILLDCCLVACLKLSVEDDNDVTQCRDEQMKDTTDDQCLWWAFR